MPTRVGVVRGGAREHVMMGHVTYLSKEDDPLEFVGEGEVKVEHGEGENQGHNTYHQEQNNPIRTTIPAAVAKVKA
jgi:hypothetical protein